MCNSIDSSPFFHKYPRITTTLQYDDYSISGPSWYTSNPKDSYQLLKPQFIQAQEKREECSYHDIHFFFSLSTNQVRRLYDFLDFKEGHPTLVEHTLIDLEWIILGDTIPLQDFHQYILLKATEISKVYSVLPGVEIHPTQDTTTDDTTHVLYQIPNGMSDNTLKEKLLSVDIDMEYIKRLKRSYCEEDGIWLWDRV